VADEQPPSPSYEELVGENADLRRQVAAGKERIARLEARLAELERRLGQNSGNSSLPSSRDPATERQRQARQRGERLDRAGRPKRKRGKQAGSKGKGLELSPDPDVIVDHQPDACESCGDTLDRGNEEGFTSRQVVELPEVRPVITEHRSHRRRCRCGHISVGAFPGDVRAPISYGPRVKALVAYLLARQHLPGRRVAETLTDCFGLNISTGTIDAVYSEAARRLGGFIAALVVFLKSLPVLHVDETSDRVGTVTCWMHVVSDRLYTLIHASVTRGEEAIRTAGVLIGYRGIVVRNYSPG
jgi:transposase